MEAPNKQALDRLNTLLEKAGKAVVVSHTHPDGDALGSATALCLWLQQCRGIGAAAILPDTPGENIRFILSPRVPTLFHDQEPAQAESLIREADVIFLVDCNAFDRTEALRQALEASPAPKVLIDHHLNPDTAAFDAVFSTPEISSASELLFWLLKALGWQVSPEIGTPLLAGMTTDTNNFGNSVYPSTFAMASELILAGVDRDAILGSLYQNCRENRVRLMGYMQSEGLHILPSGAAYMILYREIQERFDLREGESEGLVNVPLTIGDVRLSVLLKEADGYFRVSVRSKKGTSAQRFAATFFHGGGHENAAGGKLFIGPDIPAPEAAAQYLEQALAQFLG